MAADTGFAPTDLSGLGDGDWSIGPNGQQVWTARGGKFVSIRLRDGTEVKSETEDLDALSPRDCSSARCPGIGHALPFTFNYCPHCGEPTTTSNPLGLMPWPGEHALREAFPSSLTHPKSSATLNEWPTPSAGDFVLAVAGLPSRLLALDRTSGRCWVWSRTRQQWRMAESPPRQLGLDDWAFGVVADLRGLAWPLRRGLAHVAIGEHPRLLVREHDFSAEVLGAPAPFADAIVTPIGKDSLSAVALLSGDTVSTIKVAGGSGQLGRPLRNTSDQLVWPGKTGFLLLRSSTDASWVPWPKGLEGLPQLPPYQYSSGQYGQICRAGGRTYVAAKLTEPSAVMQELAGPEIGAGRYRVYNNTLTDEPTGARRHLRIAPDWFGVPLLLTGGRGLLYAAVSGISDMPLFLAGESAALRQAALRLRDGDGSEILLTQESFEIKTLSGLTACAYGNSILIYCRTGNQLFHLSSPETS